MTKASKADGKKLAREEKLAAALRANLQRRKAARRAAQSDDKTDLKDKA